MYMDKKTGDDNIIILDSLTSYFHEINRFPLLTSEEEIELAKRIEKGDLNARDLFIKSNLKLVVEIASKYIYRNKILSFQDLIQEGNIGLMKAVNKFDYRLGYRFSTYATYWIKSSISYALKERGRNIKLPKNEIKRIVIYKKIKDEYLEKYGRFPTSLEIASIMNISEEAVLSLEVFEYDVVSLNSLCEDNENEYLNCLSNPNDLVEEIYEEKEKREFIRNVLETSGLTDREIDIIKKYFGIGCKRRSIYKIADEYSLSKGRINQIIYDILRKLRRLKSLSIYNDNICELDNKEMNLNNFLVFLNKSKMSLTSDLTNQPYLIKILLESEFAKKEIDFFVLHYGFKLSLNEISLHYQDRFTSQSGKNSLRVLRNISISINTKIKKSKYVNEINEYIVNSNMIINEFIEQEKVYKKI